MRPHETKLPRRQAGIRPFLPVLVLAALIVNLRYLLLTATLVWKRTGHPGFAGGEAAETLQPAE